MDPSHHRHAHAEGYRPDALGYHAFGAPLAVDVQGGVGGGILGENRHALGVYGYPNAAGSHHLGAGAHGNMYAAGAHLFGGNKYAASTHSFGGDENRYAFGAHRFNVGATSAHSFGADENLYASGARRFNAGAASTHSFGADENRYASGPRRFNAGAASTHSFNAGAASFYANNAHAARRHGEYLDPSPSATTFGAAADVGILPADRHAGRGAPAADGAVSTSDLFALIEKTTVVGVRRSNCGDVFTDVVDKLRQPRHHLYIALDLEYAADASTDVNFRPVGCIDWYDHLRAFVNSGDVFQMGLVLAFQDHPEADPSSLIALQIDFEFNQEARDYSPVSIKFLKEQKHNLDNHRDFGVLAEWVFAGLLRHLPTCDDTVTWLTFHGDRDFAFLLRLLQAGGRGALPEDRPTFLHQVREKFPIIYDVRVLGQILYSGFTGKLTDLGDAKHLNVVRVGNAHFAGSDALFTLSCFFKIVHCSEHELHRLDAHQGLLSGVEEFSMAIKCARHITDNTIATFDVVGSNFEQESRLIEESVTNNFRVVGLEILFPSSESGSGLQYDYHTMKSSISGIESFEVVLGFINPEGLVPFGRIWKFHISSAAQNPEGAEGVHPLRLAKLLASCGATHDPSVIWTTYCGAHEVGCLVQSFLKPDDLPDSPACYDKLRQELFPVICDIFTIVQPYWEIRPFLNGSKEDMYIIANALQIECGEGAKRQSKALLVLRCNHKLADRKSRMVK